MNRTINKLRRKNLWGFASKMIDSIQKLNEIYPIFWIDSQNFNPFITDFGLKKGRIKKQQIKLGKPKVLAGKEKKSTSNPTIERVKGWRDSELRSGDSGQLVILGSRDHITWCNHVLANRGHKEKEGRVAAAAGSVPLLPRFLFCLDPSSASVPPLLRFLLCFGSSSGLVEFGFI